MAAPTTTVWLIDTARSELRFMARQMGMTVRGRFPELTGRLVIDPERPEASRVDATVRTAAVEPAMPALRGLLLSDSFLAAERYPELTFHSTGIEPGGDAYLVQGELTFRGERRVVTMETRLVSLDAAGEAPSARIEARGRADHLISDEELEVELVLVAVPAAATVAPGTTDPVGAEATTSTERAPARLRATTGAGSARTEPRARPLTLVALVGSLRQASLNAALLRAAQESAPAGVRIEPFPLREVPFYDGDLEAAGEPPSVRSLKEAIAEADGLVIVTPEYNRGLPAVIKNAIDWASRPAFASPLADKPALLLGATIGRSGTRYALQQGAETLAYTQALPFERRLGVSRAASLLDDAGRLADDDVRSELRELLDLFASFVRRTAAARKAA